MQSATQGGEKLKKLDIPGKLHKGIESSIADLAKRIDKAKNLSEVKEVVDQAQLELEKFCKKLEADIIKLHKEVVAKIPKTAPDANGVSYETASRAPIDAAFQALKDRVATARSEATEVYQAQYLKGRRKVMQSAGYPDTSLPTTNAEIDALSRVVVLHLQDRAQDDVAAGCRAAMVTHIQDRYQSLETALAARVGAAAPAAVAAAAVPDQALISAHFNEQFAKLDAHYQALLDPKAAQALSNQLQVASKRAAEALITEWETKPGASTGAPKDVAVICNTTVNRSTMPWSRSAPQVKVTAPVLTADRIEIVVSGGDKFGVLSSGDKTVRTLISETAEAVQGAMIEDKKRARQQFEIIGFLPVEACLEASKALLKTWVAGHGVDKSLLRIWPKELEVALLGRPYVPFSGVFNKYMGQYQESQRKQIVDMSRSEATVSKHSRPEDPKGMSTTGDLDTRLVFTGVRRPGA